MRILKSFVAYSTVFAGLSAGFESSLSAQTCVFNFNPNPAPASVTIESYWVINGYNSPSNPSLFLDTVTVGNSTVPPGSYLGWCIDTADSIDNGPEDYNVLMFSSTDPNLDTELAALGYTYHFTYPSTDTKASAAQWNQLNYLLNHPLNGASYWDMQAAIWNIIGGPLEPNSYFTSNFSSSLTYNTNNVGAMVQSSLANAASWQLQCGDVIAVVLAITVPDDQFHDFPVQLTIIEAPFASIPNIGVTPMSAGGNVTLTWPTNAAVFNSPPASGAGYTLQFCTNLNHPVWTSLQTLTATNGVLYYSEPLQTNIAGRFYRITSP
jgi:hypothetical protein